PRGRDVGRIGFEHQGLKGQLLRQPPDLQGPREGHGPAKPKRKAPLDELAGLLKAAVEGMRNPPYVLAGAQMLEQYVLRAPDMQNERKAVALGQVELATIEQLLYFAHGRRLEIRQEKIQADFADGHEPGIIQRDPYAGLQHIQVG